MKLAPELEALMQQFSQFSFNMPVTPDGVPALREQLASVFRGVQRTVRSDVAIIDSEAAGVPVRIYRPRDAVGPLPLHVYYHGGAFMFGSVFSGAEDAELADRAVDGRCVAVSVEYRLAPEHRFPAGVEDGYAALCALVKDAEAIGVDVERVTLGGVSSGGNFAAVIALLAKDRGGPRIALQLLELAGTDLTKSSHAWRNPAPGHDTTRAADLALIDFYLNSVAERASPLASPLFYPDLEGVAPAYMMNAEFDPRRDECEAYAARLRDAGVPAIAKTMMGHIHLSLMLPDWAPVVEWRAHANNILAAVHRGEPLQTNG